jgi:predicted Zn-dependent peptidase
MQEICNKTIDEKMYFAEHESGLKIYLMHKKGYTKQFAIFAAHYGSNDCKFIIPGENDITQVPDGIAHFLEHKMFEEEEGSIFEKFSKNGASANAFTNFTTTAYLFASTDKFYENLKLLVNFVQNPYFTDENIEKEKGIIGQEIRMYEDDPNWRVYFNMLDALYHIHPVKIDIAGTIDSISKINKEMLYKCYKTFYHPSNMVLFAVGDIDINKSLKIITDNIKEKSKQGAIKRICPDEPNTVNKDYVEQKMSVSMPIFNIGFKDTDVGYGGKKLLKKDLSTQISLELLAGRSSDTYEELYNEGLIDNTFETEYIGEIDHGYSIIGGQSKNPRAVKDLILNKLTNTGNFKKEDFERIKKKFMGRFLRAFNSVDGIGQSFISFYMKDINILDYLDVLKEIQYIDIINRFKHHLNKENSVLSVIKP